jgi:hypothetical protein
VAVKLCASVGHLALSFVRKEHQRIIEAELMAAEWLEHVGTMEESVQVKGPKWLEGVNNLIKNLQITRVK